MSDATVEAVHDHGGGHVAHDEVHAQNPFLAHHFDTPAKQFEAGKFGIWLFLTTEVLFFSGLFCAYAVYRTLDPDTFEWGHYFLNTRLGAINTSVLIFSSLTAAWAVRNAQLRQHRHLMVNIVLTLLCATAFMGIKYHEWGHKFELGLFPGRYFQPTEEVWEQPSYAVKNGPAPAGLLEGTPAGIAAGEKLMTRGHPYKFEPPPNAARFFALYFCMTGLHGIHVLAGMVVWTWMLLKARKKQFGPDYYGPIDFAALYWHLVDIIWIYLFPLLYLID